MEKIKTKKPKVELFTDEMAKNIYPFQEGYKQSKMGKPTQPTISFKSIKK